MIFVVSFASSFWVVMVLVLIFEAWRRLKNWIGWCAEGRGMVLLSDVKGRCCYYLAIVVGDDSVRGMMIVAILHR